MNKLKFSELPDKEHEQGDIFTVKEFIEAIKKGWFNEYDGSGYWATETQVSNSYFDFNSKNFGFPSEFKATHVCWYNK